MKQTEIRSFIPADKVKSYSMDENTTMTTLDKLGFSFDSTALRDLRNNLKSYSMDENIPMITPANITSPIQFLQFWLQDVIRVMTTARKIDAIAGRTIAGTWADEEIVQTYMELTGQAKIYADHGNVPLASFNETFEKRTIVRLELGCETTILEEERSNKMRINASSEKKLAVAEALAILLNKIGFYGYNDGTNRTYGMLNDPNMPAYRTVAVGTSGNTEWNTKDFLEITSDIKTAIQQGVTQCDGNFDPYSDSFQLDFSLNVQQALDTMNSLGTQSVKQWIKDTYPKCRMEFVPQLNEANGGANVMYIIVDSLNGKGVINQYIPDVLRLLGVEKKVKGMLEDYSSATSGFFTKQPLGITRYSGI